MAIKDRLIQFIFRGKEELSPEAKKAKEALELVRKEAGDLTEQLDKARDAQGLADTLQRTREAAERSQSTLDRAEKKAEELRKELNEKPDSRGLAESLRAAEREAARAARELDRMAAATKTAEEAAKAAGLDTANLAAEQKRLTDEVGRARRATQEKGKQLKELEREYRRAARASAEHKSRVDAARESMTRGAKQVIGLATAYLSLRTAMRLVQGGLNLVRDGIRSMLSVGSDMEQLQIRFNGLMGSMSAGENAVKWIRQFAEDTGQRIPDVAEAFALLKAYGLDPMDGSLRAITDKTMQLGGGLERLQGITAALGQMWAKERIQQEEVLQLTERGVVVWPMLEKAMGRTTAELQEMARRGELGRDAVRAFIEEIGRSAEGQAAQGLNTLTGRVNLLRNRFELFFDRIAQSGAMDAVKDRLSGVADQIDRMDQDGTLERLAVALSSAFVQGLEKVEEFTRGLRDVDFMQLTNDSIEWLNNFGRAIDDARMRVQLFFAPFRSLFNGLTSGVLVVVAVVARKLDTVIGQVERIAELIPEMFGGAKVRQRLAEFREQIQAVSSGALDQIRQDGEDIADAWDTTWRHAAKGQKDVVKATEEAREKTKGFAEQIAEAGDRLEDAGQQAEDTASSINDAALALENFADAQRAIANAATDVDVRDLRNELVKLYRDGKLSADEYNAAVAELADRQKVLRDSANAQAAAQADVAARAYETASALRDQASASHESAAALAGQAQAAQSSSNALGNFFAAVLTKARTSLADLSATALATWDAMRGITSVDMKIDTSSVDGLRKALEQLEASIGKTQRALANPEMNPFNRWAHETIYSSQQLQKETLQQKLRLEELMEGYETGAITLANFRSHAQALKTSLKLLDDTDLSKLDSALASVEQRMKSVGDSARSTLDSLRDELDRLRGDEEAIERRRMVSRQQELQAQLAEARAAGNKDAVSELQQALAMLNTIRSEQAKQRLEAERQSRRGPGAPAGSAGSPAAAQTPATVIRLESPRGSAVDVSVAPGQESALLSLLEQAGMRTIS